MDEMHEIWRLSKILKHMDIPVYLGSSETPFKYPDGYKELLQKKIDELAEQWRKNHPNALMNR